MVLSVKYHLLTLLRVSNIDHLPAKPDQVAKAGRFERKPNQTSSLILCQNQRENNIKKSKLAYCFNYKKTAIP